MGASFIRGDGYPGSPGNWRAIARSAFLVLAGIAAVLLILKERDALEQALSRTDPVIASAALAMAMVNIALTWVSWRLLLRSAPAAPDWAQSARIFFLGQVGKYLPGSVWSYLASAELAKQAGLPRATAVSSLFLAVLIGLGSGLLVAIAIVPETIDLASFSWWMVLIIAPAALVLAWPPAMTAILRAARIDFPMKTTSLFASGASACIAWIFAGAMIALLARALGLEFGWSLLAYATGAYALAWVSGFLFFIAPAGLGAREAVLVAMLAARMPLSDAVIIAMLARVVMTITDLILAGIALLIRPTTASPATAPRPHRG